MSNWEKFTSHHASEAILKLMIAVLLTFYLLRSWCIYQAGSNDRAPHPDVDPQPQPGTRPARGTNPFTFRPKHAALCSRKSDGTVTEERLVWGCAMLSLFGCGRYFMSVFFNRILRIDMLSKIGQNWWVPHSPLIISQHWFRLWLGAMLPE